MCDIVCGKLNTRFLVGTDMGRKSSLGGLLTVVRAGIMSFTASLKVTISYIYLLLIHDILFCYT